MTYAWAAVDRVKRCGAVRLIGMCCVLALLTVAIVRFGRAEDKAKPASNDRSPQFVVVDVARALSMHQRMKAKKEELDVEIKDVDTEVVEMKKEVEDLKTRHDKLAKDSPDREQLATDLLRRQAELAVKIQQARRKFIEREISIHREAHEQIKRAVNDYLTEHRVAIALSKNLPADETTCGITMPRFEHVLAYQPSVDVTDDIIRRVNAVK